MKLDSSTVQEEEAGQAIMVIEKDEEILISYRGDKNEFLYGSREFRRRSC